MNWQFLQLLFPGVHCQFKAELEAESLGLAPGKCCSSRPKKPEENIAVTVDQSENIGEWLEGF